MYTIILECLSIVIIVTISVTNSSIYDDDINMNGIIPAKPDLQFDPSAINKFSKRFYSVS